MALTDTAVRQAKTQAKSYTLRDIEGLSLFVDPRGYKNWHFRFTWLGARQRISLGTYPEITLKEARQRRDEARNLVAQGIDPRLHRHQNQQQASDKAMHTFHSIFTRWRDFRALTLSTSHNGTLLQINRIFANDILPSLGKRSVFDITRQDLVEVVRKIEQRDAKSIAEKSRAWLKNLFRYAMVKTGLTVNPAADLDIVAVPQDPVRHNPWLSMSELPGLLKVINQYRGAPQTRLGLLLLLLTGVRTGELRHATSEQFDLDQGLWIIPPENVKQLKRQTEVQRIDPYIVPLSRQARAIVEYLLENRLPAQHYLLVHRSQPQKVISENTLNQALRRMGYSNLLTGHGIRGTISTALNELGYQRDWIEAQLSHVDNNKVRAAYNHASYVEQRRTMMQAWADLLDKLMKEGHQPEDRVPELLDVVPDTINPSTLAPNIAEEVFIESPLLLTTRREVHQQPMLTDTQRQHAERLLSYESPHNLPVSTFARLAGKSRDQINRDIKASHLLTINIGNRGQRIPEWQLDPLRQQLFRELLTLTVVRDPWQIYHALSAHNERLGGIPIEMVTESNLCQLARDVCIELRR